MQGKTLIHILFYVVVVGEGNKGKMKGEQWRNRGRSQQTEWANCLWACVCVCVSLNACDCVHLHMFELWVCSRQSVWQALADANVPIFLNLTTATKASIPIAPCLSIKKCHLVLPSWPSNCKIIVTPTITNVHLDVQQWFNVMGAPSQHEVEGTNLNLNGLGGWERAISPFTPNRSDEDFCLSLQASSQIKF